MKQLPWALLGIPAMVRKDFGWYSVDLVFQHSPFLPGELFWHSTPQLSYTTLTHHHSLTPCSPLVTLSLDSSPIVYIHVDSHCTSLQPLYSGPCGVLHCCSVHANVCHTLSPVLLMSSPGWQALTIFRCLNLHYVHSTLLPLNTSCPNKSLFLLTNHLLWVLHCDRQAHSVTWTFSSMVEIRFPSPIKLSWDFPCNTQVTWQASVLGYVVLQLIYLHAWHEWLTCTGGKCSISVRITCVRDRCNFNRPFETQLIDLTIVSWLCECSMVAHACGDYGLGHACHVTQTSMAAACGLCMAAALGSLSFVSSLTDTCNGYYCYLVTHAIHVLTDGE